MKVCPVGSSLLFLFRPNGSSQLHGEITPEGSPWNRARNSLLTVPCREFIPEVSFACAEGSQPAMPRSPEECIAEHSLLRSCLLDRKLTPGTHS